MEALSPSFFARKLEILKKSSPLLTATILMDVVLLASILLDVLFGRMGKTGLREALSVFAFAAFMPPFLRAIAMAPYWFLMWISRGAKAGDMQVVAFIFQGLAIVTLFAGLALAVFGVATGNVHGDFIAGILLLGGYICAALTWGISRLQYKTQAKKAGLT